MSTPTTAPAPQVDWRKLMANAALGIVGDTGTLRARFWCKVRRGGGRDCWPWQGARNECGYGVIGRGGRDSGNAKAHQVSFFLSRGYWPKRLVLHKCDNPPCVNPRHLYEGTAKQNAHDAIRRGRHSPPPHFRGEANGRAKLTAPRVRRIRELYRRGTHSLASLARRYDVSKKLVLNIIHRRTWTHV